MYMIAKQMTSSKQHHETNSEWIFWAHMPHDTNWSLDSYKKIISISKLEDLFDLYKVTPDILIQNCMLFIMKDNIKPIWEDPSNRKGGCFSYKILNKDVPEIWKKLSFGLIGESVSNNNDFVETVNGITISPKKNFCIIKVWVKTCKFQDPSLILDSFGLPKVGCLFRQHNPEF